MSEVSLNTNVQPKKETHIEAVETGGVIASNTNTPSPLFNAVPAAPSVETGGSIASSSSSSSSGGSTSFVC
ncbi:MAG: hypothetical protein IJB79_06390 [Candidatus Gastranaerophilales bacterium]|nr:hypothetical protein [Candidatus Gastranaerophilales bacterium]